MILIPLFGIQGAGISPSAKALIELTYLRWKL
jgi:hypothetical protein